MDSSKKNANGFYGPTFEEWQAELKAEADARAVLRESAIAKLAQLGLTPDEITSLIP